MKFTLWFHKKSISSHHSLESKFVCWLEEKWIHIIIFFLFLIGHHKLILLIGINDVDDFISFKKFFFQPFFRIKVHLSITLNKDSHSNLFSFHDWVPKTHSTYCDKWHWCFGFTRKASLSTVFRIKVLFSIGTNTDSHNNLFLSWLGTIN